MIKGTFLIFIILFSAYNGFLKLNKDDRDTAQSSYQNNIIKADRYIYGNKTPEAVIVGSSLSTVIIKDSLPGIYNLAMGGMSQFDGCHIVLKRKKLPASIFIETNFFFNPEKKEFKAIFDSKARYFFKDKFLAVRDENQPIGILKYYLDEHDHAPAGPVTSRPVRPDVLNEILQHAIKFFSKADTNQIKAASLKLKKNIRLLQERGVKVYFYEMPVNPRLKGLALPAFARKTIKTDFPDIPFIPAPQTEFNTTDGIHLHKEEAIKYTHYLKYHINKLSSADRQSRFH